MKRFFFTIFASGIIPDEWAILIGATISICGAGVYFLVSISHKMSTLIADQKYVMKATDNNTDDLKEIKTNIATIESRVRDLEANKRSPIHRS